MTTTDSLTLSALPLPPDPDAIDAYLEEQTAALARVIDDALRSIVQLAIDSFDPLALVAAGDPASFDSMHPSWQSVVDDEVAPIVAKVYTDTALTAVLTSNAPPNYRALMEPVINEAAVEYTRTATNRIVGAGQSLWTSVRDELTTSVAEGQSVEELKDTIEQLTGYSEFRSDTIARTETMMSYNAGDHETSKALGEFGPAEKQWLAALDARTRESHAEANDQVVAFDEDFIVGGVRMPYPGNGPPEETINCRCTTLSLYHGDTRPDGTTVGVDPLDPDAPAAVTSDMELGFWIKSQLAADPDQSAASLIKQWKANGGKVNDKRFRDIFKEVKSGGTGVRTEAVASKGERTVFQRLADESRGGGDAPEYLATDRTELTARIRSHVGKDFVEHATVDGEFTFFDEIGGSAAKSTDYNLVGIQRNGVTITGPKPPGWSEKVLSGQYKTYDDALDALRRYSQTWDRQLSNFDRLYETMPPELRGAVNRINISPTRNPADDYWAKRYGSQGFRSAATGGNRGITIYSDYPISTGSLRHEYGHNLEQLSRDFVGNYEKMSDSPQWRNAMRSDALGNDAKFIRGGPNLTPADVRGLTPYGQSAPGEDVAEAVRLYLADQDLGHMPDMKGYRFAELFPERARLIEHMLDNAADQLKFLGEGPGAPQRVVQQTVKTFADAVGGKGDIVNGEVFTSGGTISQSNAADPRRWAKVRDAYVGADDKTLLYNQRMRAGGKLTGGAARHARDMRWLTEQGSFSTDATVYRGAILNDAQVSQLQAGFTLTDKAPMSTGFSQDVAEFYAKERRRDGASGETVIFKIQARAGQHAADVSGEIVLPPGSSLTVQNVTRRADGVLEVLAWLA